MKALITDGHGGLSVDELAIPVIGDYQALTRTLSCGVCAGTDAKIVHGSFKGFDAYPASLGHEAIGEVVELGSKVTSFHLGDRVTLPFIYHPTNGVTPGWGAFAEYGVIGDAAALTAAGRTDFDETYLAQKVLPADVDPVAGAMIVTLREVFTAVRQFGLEAGQSAVIFGAGPVGLAFTAMAALTGVKRVMVIDIDDAKCAEASALGATHTLNSTTADAVAWVRNLVPAGVDRVIDAVGVNALLNQGLGMIADRGKLCAYGISPTTHVDLDWTNAPYNWQLLFHQFPRKAEEGAAHDQIMNWLRSGQLKLTDFVSHRFDFAHILDAFALVEAHQPGTKKIVITYP